MVVPTERATALVIPIFRRYWLWHGWKDPMANVQMKEALKPWRQGATLEEKFSLLIQRLNIALMNRVMKEWHQLESAKEGTLRNKGYRLAQSVLSREDPKETFLKSIPREVSAELKIIYPEGYKERLVRRRLRHLVAEGKRRHRTRLVWWMLALVPQIPLMVTPLPNITVYYTIYRLVSHVQALQGSKSAERGFAALDSQQLGGLRDELLILQHREGIRFPEDSWPALLIKRESTYLDIFDRLRLLQKQRRLEEMRKKAEMNIDTEPRNMAVDPFSDLEGSETKRAPVPSAETILRKTSWLEGMKDNIKHKIRSIWRPTPDDKKIDVKCEESAVLLKTREQKISAPTLSSILHEQQSHKTNKCIESSKTYHEEENATNEDSDITKNSELHTDDELQPCTGMKLVFQRSSNLATIVKPTERLKYPIDDTASMSIAREFKIDSLMESVARARRRAVGSMFPYVSSNQDTGKET